MKTDLFIALTMTLITYAAFAEGTAAKETTQKTTVTSKKTVMDQGMNQQDTNLTRTIRERIVADKSLSMRAKNVTIISSNGQVTLKGPVATTTEQAKVEEIAKKVAGAQSVINQTEVSTNY